ELNAYYEANKDVYFLERTENTGNHNSIGFLDACDKYDAEYFEDQILLMILLEEGSGSVRHEVKRVGTNADKVFVDIKSIVPEIGTADMAEWHVLIEPEAGVDIASETDVVVFLDGRNATEKHTIATHSKGFANISVTLKDGWAYEIKDTDTAEFSINIYPEDQPQNKLRVAYCNGFGVCGTGLTGKTIMLGGYEAWMGTYDNQSVWDFIHLRGLPGDYVIFNEGGEAWWKEYGDDAMQILATIKAANGYITESEAIRIARDKLQAEYDEVNASFSAASGIWTVTMSQNQGLDRYVMTVTMDIYGNIREIYNPDEPVCAEKPVIYLYPTEEARITVQLNLDGNLICTYPKYNDGWTVTAAPDGALTDASGRKYYCLYWEGNTCAEYDFSRGFCVRGEDTAAFLEDTLARMGLTEREANEFIIYWLPQMEKNPYNLISFQSAAYTDSAELSITPAPDSLLRVFMAWKPLETAIRIEPQVFAEFKRVGFAVVEWGGAKVK
ncbi:MAG: hypothetical protein J6S76_04985, partial [Clostridia bacterium]|nr:hypothetical protein [Clostridia bacterium]